MILWNAETKTVEIYDYRIAELQDLAYGICMLEGAKALSSNIRYSLNDLINHRNDLVADCWNNVEEIYADRINDLNGTKEHLTWHIENYVPILCEYLYTKAINTDDIKNAFYYCQMAIKNIELAYNELDKYDSKKDNSIILQNYAIYVDKAKTYNSDANKIFSDCGSKILDVIYSY